LKDDREYKEKIEVGKKMYQFVKEYDIGCWTPNVKCEKTHVNQTTPMYQPWTKM